MSIYVTSCKLLALYLRNPYWNVLERSPNNLNVHKREGLKALSRVRLGLSNSQSIFTCSKLTIETLEQGVKYVLKDTTTTPMASFWCHYCLLWTCFRRCYSVFILNFQQTNAGWVIKTDIVLKIDWNSFWVLVWGL